MACPEEQGSCVTRGGQAMLKMIRLKTKEAKLTRGSMES